MHFTIFYLILGLGLIVIGADYFIAGSSYIAKRFGVPKLIIGLTIVALGTSAPEFAVNIISSIQGHNQLAMGNVLGSNIANILLIFAGAALFIKTITISKDSLTQVSLGLLVSIFVIVLCIFSFGLDQSMQISQYKGLALLLLGLFYWLYLYKITKADKERLEVDEIEHNKLQNIKSLSIVIGITLFSLIALLFGSNLATKNAVIIAQSLGIPELIIAATIISIGTSLPELVTGIQAIRQKQFDLLVGNVVGSNIINSLFILGTSALIHSIPVTNDAINYLAINIIASILLLVSFTLFKPRVFKRWQAIVLVIVYIIFLIYTLT